MPVTWVDWLIAGMFLLQIGALAAIALIALRIRNDIVNPLMQRGKRIAAHGKMLAASGKQVAIDNREHLMGAIDQGKRLRTALTTLPGEADMQDQPISLGKIFTAVTTLRSAQRGWRTIQGFTKRKSAPTAKTALQAKKSKPKPSLGVRLGLVPPAAKHLGTILRYGRIAMDVRKQLREYGIF